MNYFQRYLAEEFAEDYEEGRISRRKALRLLLGATGSLTLANTILAACTPPANEPADDAAASTLAPTESGAIPTTGSSPSPAATTASTGTTAPTAATTSSSTETPGTSIPSSGTQAPYGTVSPDDPAVTAGPVEFPGEGATLKGYQAVPAGQDGPLPVILVCHENRGLTPHIEDVTRRLAKAGYAALAVDLLSRQGGASALSPDAVPGLLANTPPEQFVSDFRSGWAYLGSQAFADAGRVGMVGFCFGGGVTWRVAVDMPELRAAVPYYGPPPPVEDVPKIQAAVLAIYAGNDARINASIPAIEEVMKANNKIYEKEIYPNVDHAFNNDTGTRYAPEAARAAWSRTLNWFERYVRG